MNNMAGFLLVCLVALCLILLSYIVIFATRQGNIDFLDSFVFFDHRSIFRGTMFVC